MNIKTALAAIALVSIAGCASTKVVEEPAPAPETTVESQAPAAAEPGSAAQVCGDNGHDVVTWTDQDGEAVQACRRSDGVEYALKDAAFFTE